MEFLEAARIKIFQQKYNFLYAIQYKSKLKGLINKNKSFILTVAPCDEIEDFLLFKPICVIQQDKLIPRINLPSHLIYIGEYTETNETLPRKQYNIHFQNPGIIIESQPEFEEHPKRMVRICFNRYAYQS